jgi:hypothetical protein
MVEVFICQYGKVDIGFRKPIMVAIDLDWGAFNKYQQNKCIELDLERIVLSQTTHARRYNLDISNVLERIRGHQNL